MIRLLIADDSALMRRLFNQLFADEGDFEIAVAHDGLEALQRLASFQPDVIVLDVHMPKLDGIACLDRIMVERPTPVVMVSALTQEGADETLRALELGAVDVVAKPSGALSLKMDLFGPKLVKAVRAAAAGTYSLGATSCGARARPRWPDRSDAAAPAGVPNRVAAASLLEGRRRRGDRLLHRRTGGARCRAVRASREFPLAAGGRPAHAGDLHRRAGASARRSLRAHGQGGDRGATPLRAGEVYIGRGDADLLVAARSGGLVAIAAPQSDEFRWHPSVDRLTDSVMAHATASQHRRRADDRHGQRRRGGDGAVSRRRRPDHRGGGRDGGRLGHAGRTGARRRRRMRRAAGAHRPAARRDWSYEREPRGYSRQRALTAEELERFCEYLYRRTGMIFDESKRYYIDRRLADRMRATGDLELPRLFRASAQRAGRARACDQRLHGQRDLFLPRGASVRVHEPRAAAGARARSGGGQPGQNPLRSLCDAARNPIPSRSGCWKTGRWSTLTTSRSSAPISTPPH